MYMHEITENLGKEMSCYIIQCLCFGIKILREFVHNRTDKIAKYSTCGID